MGLKEHTLNRDKRLLMILNIGQRGREAKDGEELWTMMEDKEEELKKTNNSAEYVETKGRNRKRKVMNALIGNPSKRQLHIQSSIFEVKNKIFLKVMYLSEEQQPVKATVLACQSFGRKIFHKTLLCMCGEAL